MPYLPEPDHHHPLLASPTRLPFRPPPTRPASFYPCPQALKAANLPKNLKGMKGDVQMNPRQMQAALGKMSRALPPQLMQQLGGMSGLQSLMKGLDGKMMGGMGK